MINSLPELLIYQQDCTDALEIFKDQKLLDQFTALEKCIERIAQSSSSSWIGYQAYVYYKNFMKPPSDDAFSIEWGLQEGFVSSVSDNWREFTYEQVVNAILKCAHLSDSDINTLERRIKEAISAFNNSKEEIINILEMYLNFNEDKYLEKLLKDIKKILLFTQQDITLGNQPRHQIATRDMRAASQGSKVPPHIAFQSFIMYLKVSQPQLEKLNNTIKTLIKYIQKYKSGGNMDSKEKCIFIGHGRSDVWKDLKSFVNERLKLKWEEFNRESPAGIPTTDRLQTMLLNSDFAFIVMTAEDETADGKMQARMNVIHETGLFQGKLGFRKAIVLLEEGCEEFSNIHGLGQIRFSKGNISSCYEEIRKVLERENII